MNPILQLIALIVHSDLFTFLTSIISPLEKLQQLFANPNKLLCYSIRSFSLVEDRFGKVDLIKILYKNQAIPRLTLTRVAIWSAGKEPIRYTTDIPTNLQLKICLNAGYQILQLDVMDIQEIANNFECQLSNSSRDTEAFITFEYLEKNEGVTIQIIHTGELHQNLELEGRVIGGKLRRVSYTKSRANIPIYWTSLVSALVATFVNLVLLFLLHQIPYDRASVLYRQLFLILFTVVFNFIFIVIVELFFYKRITRIPKQFQKFHEQSWKI